MYPQLAIPNRVAARAPDCRSVLASVVPDQRLTIALVAHDARKDLLNDWVGCNLDVLESAALFSTASTGKQLGETHAGLSIDALKSGPLGGDQQIGSLICEGALDALIFFVDPLSSMPHDVDVKALTRLATVYDVPMASSPATANLIAAGIRTGALSAALGQVPTGRPTRSVA